MSHRKAVHTADMFRRLTRDVFEGDERWRGLKVPAGETFAWDANPPTSSILRTSKACRSRPAGRRTSRARACWLKLGDSITTDHISPAGIIKSDGPAGQYLHRTRRRSPWTSTATARAAATTR